MLNGLLPFAAPIEFWQFFFAAIALLMGFWRLWISIQNGLAITHSDGKDLRRVIAETAVIGELFRLFAIGILLGIGGSSVLIPPPSHDNAFYNADDEQGDLQLLLTRFGLITLTVVMVVDSFVQEWRRRQFLSYVAAEVAATIEAEEKEARAAQEKLSDAVSKVVD